MDDQLERVIRQQLRKAGKQFEEAKRAYSEAKTDPAGDGSGAEQYDLPTDDEGAPGSSVADTLSAGPSPSTPRDDRRVSRAATPTARGARRTCGKGSSRPGERRRSQKFTQRRFSPPPSHDP